MACYTDIRDSKSLISQSHWETLARGKPGLVDTNTRGRRGNWFISRCWILFPKRKSGINSSGAFPLWVTLRPGPDTSEQGKYHSQEVANASATSFLSLLGAGHQIFGTRQEGHMSAGREREERQRAGREREQSRSGTDK